MARKLWKWSLLCLNSILILLLNLRRAEVLVRDKYKSDCHFPKRITQLASCLTCCFVTWLSVIVVMVELYNEKQTWCELERLKTDILLDGSQYLCFKSLDGYLHFLVSTSVLNVWLEHFFWHYISYITWQKFSLRTFQSSRPLIPVNHVLRNIYKICQD